MRAGRLPRRPGSAARHAVGGWPPPRPSRSCWPPSPPCCGRRRVPPSCSSPRSSSSWPTSSCCAGRRHSGFLVTSLLVPSAVAAWRWRDAGPDDDW